MSSHGKSTSSCIAALSWHIQPSAEWGRKDPPMASKGYMQNSWKKVSFSHSTPNITVYVVWDTEMGCEKSTVEKITCEALQARAVLPSEHPKWWASLCGLSAMTAVNQTRPVGTWNMTSASTELTWQLNFNHLQLDFFAIEVYWFNTISSACFVK